jgi:phosphate transport system permease protein
MIRKKFKARIVKNILFKLSCLFGIITALLLLGFLIVSIFLKSYQVFFQPVILVSYDYPYTNNIDEVKHNMYDSIHKKFDQHGINISNSEIMSIVSLDAARELLHNKNMISPYIKANNIVGEFLKYKDGYSNSKNYILLQKLLQSNLIDLKFSLGIFTQKDSRSPESAGVLGGLVGSAMIIFICLLFSIPLGVISAIYLEEFATKGVIRNIIEININNLAAVPSIVYGLIGLFLFVVHLNIPRSSALAVGLTLGFLTLPTIIVCTRQAIRNIPKHIKQGALALGASPMQVTLHHILPLATPGIITGAILSISRAIGETAPLIMLGMVAFIPDIPTNFTEPTSALPVLIYTWFNSPEYGFVEKVSAAILLLIFVIISLNYLAIGIRNKYQHRW